jgi:adenylate kinase
VNSQAKRLAQSQELTVKQTYESHDDKIRARSRVKQVTVQEEFAQDIAFFNPFIIDIDL